MGLSCLQVGMLGVAGVATFSGIALASVARTTKAALPARTTTDVRTLATRERAVISDLSTFQELSAKDRIGPWAAKLKADEGMQAAALAALGRDLGAVAATTQKQSGPHVIFATSGSGATSTRPFTIPHPTTHGRSAGAMTARMLAVRGPSITTSIKVLSRTTTASGRISSARAGKVLSTTTTAARSTSRSTRSAAGQSR